MTQRTIRRAQELKARKEMARKARKDMDRKTKNSTLRAEELALNPPADFLNFREDPNVPVISNAQFSAGPTSQEGKAKALLNAVKTGLTSCTMLLPSDDAADYEAHIQAFAAEYAPVGLREADLVQSIADTFWRMKRIPCLESAFFAKGYLEFADAFDQHDPSVRPGLIQAEAFLKYEKQLRNLQLQEARLFRRYEKDRAELLNLQQARQQRETEALQIAAAHFEAARQDNQPFDATVNGFEFSTDEIELYLSDTKARNAARNPSLPPARAHAQAA